MAEDELRANEDLINHYESELADGLQSFQVRTNSNICSNILDVLGSATCKGSQC